MTWGPQLEFLLELKEDGQDPQALRDRPQLSARQSNFIGMFYELSSSRGYSAGGTPLAIPMSEFKSYFETFQVTFLPERETVVKMVQAADRKYMEVSDKMAQERAKKRDR